MRKLALAMTAVAACAFGSVANAAPVITTITPTTPTDNDAIGSATNSSIISGTPTCAGAGSGGFACSFTSVFNFTTPVGYNLASATISSNYTDSQFAQDINFTTADLNGSAFTFNPNGQFEFGSVGNVALNTGGTNALTVNGLAGRTALGANASFSGVLSFAAAQSPVPEPATWAMMLVGFGAVGFGMRRRTSARVRIQAA